MQEDLLISFAVKLRAARAALGFAPAAIVMVYDDPDCNAVVCCMYQDRHYHIPYRRPEGQRSSFVAKKLRDDPAWADSFLNDQLQKLVKASSAERLFMEVPDNEVRIN